MHKVSFFFFVCSHFFIIIQDKTRQDKRRKGNQTKTSSLTFNDFIFKGCFGIDERRIEKNNTVLFIVMMMIMQDDDEDVFQMSWSRLGSSNNSNNHNRTNSTKRGLPSSFVLVSDNHSSEITPMEPFVFQLQQHQHQHQHQSVEVSDDDDDDDNGGGRTAIILICPV